MMSTLIRLGFLALIAINLSACVGMAINGSTLAVRSMGRGELEQLSEAGNADAQYELGVSHCCMGVGFDTQLATEWLCKAASQGQRDAMYELGRIYLGEVSRTPAPMQKVRQLATAKESRAHAWYWLDKAESLVQPDAARKLRTLERKITEEEHQHAAAMTDTPESIPCEYDDVFMAAS
jgi:TPR repeat protein